MTTKRFFAAPTAGSSLHWNSFGTANQQQKKKKKKKKEGNEHLKAGLNTQHFSFMKNKCKLVEIKNREV